MVNNDKSASGDEVVQLTEVTLMAWKRRGCSARNNTKKKKVFSYRVDETKVLADSTRHCSLCSESFLHNFRAAAAMRLNVGDEILQRHRSASSRLCFYE